MNMMGKYCCIEITIVSIGKTWTCYFNERKTVKENLKEFYLLVKDDIIHDYNYSENLMCFDRASEKRINTELTLNESGIYEGMNILLF